MASEVVGELKALRYKKPATGQLWGKAHIILDDNDVVNARPFKGEQDNVLYIFVGKYLTGSTLASLCF